MKYLRKYKTVDDARNDLMYNPEFPYPSVVYCEDEKLVDYFKEPVVEPLYVDLGLPSGTLWCRWNV